jgi:hypothetical protein
MHFIAAPTKFKGFKDTLIGMDKLRLHILNIRTYARIHGREHVQTEREREGERERERERKTDRQI